MPAFSKALLLGGISPDNILRSSLSLNLNCNTTAETNQTLCFLQPTAIETPARTPPPSPRLSSISITEPLDEQYKAELYLSVCKKAPAFQESLSKLLHEVQKGDEVL